MPDTTLRASAETAVTEEPPAIIEDRGGDVPALPPDTIAKARRYFDSARAVNTLRTYRSGWLAFVRWAERQGVQTLPAAPATVAAFAAEAADADYKPATIKNRLSAIAAIHRHEGHANPCDAQAVRDIVKGISRERGTRQDQARGLTDRDVARIEAHLGDDVRDRRDHAMLLVARDLLARRSELVALDVADIALTDAGDGTVTIRRSKTDQAGAGAVGYLSPPAADALKRYLDNADITEGAVFRTIRNGGHVGGRASERLVQRRVKRMAERAGLDAARVSGHSARVGMSQDLAAHGASVTELMQCGRWASARMPARYTEKQAARRNAVARYHATG